MCDSLGAVSATGVTPAFRVLQWWGEEGGDERLSSSVEL